MSEFNDISGIRISLASPEQIRSWSHGEVTKAETINYRTLKPERDGLFCERIFGPVKDFECHCGKYKKARYRGVICDKCGVEVAPSSVRRERMGHIELASPVAHIWFNKLVPSQLALILDISPRDLERVIYFAQHIVISVDGEARQKRVHQLEEEVAKEIAAQEEHVNHLVKELEAKAKSGEETAIKEINQLRAEFAHKKIEIGEELKAKKEKVESLQPLKLLGEEECRELRNKYGDIFEVGIGAEAVLELLKKIDVDKLYQDLLEEVRNVSGEKRNKISKRLQLVEAFRLSGCKPEWMILTVLPVLPPALRPIVQLDNGRFATSDLNDLYRRVINRNNRLRRLLALGAPEIIIRNEKRMLQEAVDALIDNGRRRPVVTTGRNHVLKSLSAMLSGKQGRFRQNLLGKRVDYSGRSVIVVGPQLKIHQCGLPRHVALELFKPFVMHKLIEMGYANNLKNARHQLERTKVRPEVWDLLAEVVKDRPVLLNRAPTLHRLSIQAFEPVLIDGDAFQLHPLACAAFNADFDGDQMAVHVPLSKAAVKEAKEHLLSVHNMLLPSCGEPVMAPTLDMVLGCYYLTALKPGAKGEGKVFSDFEEAKLAYELGLLELRATILVRNEGKQGEKIETTVGRILFNDALPSQLRFCNKVIDKAALRDLTAECVRLLGNAATAVMLDNLKQLGFDYATKSGISIAMNDMEEPPAKSELLREADKQIGIIEDQFRHGLVTEDERYENAVQVWMKTTDEITENVSQSLDRNGGIYMMATSGAKGNISQITQMVGMRGLMTDPSGRIIDFPIKSSFRDGLSPMEYFISTHGARKGLADTALRTSNAGYLTRRLVDVCQDVIVAEMDCGTTQGIWISEETDKGPLPSFGERIIGYLAASRIVDPHTGEVIVERNEEIDDDRVKRIIEASITRVYVRSPLSCQSRFGVCQYCYGRDLARRQLVKLGTAVGIIAAQSIGEPGTQLTLRTFHTGGVVGTDITSGLPRVVELFEARVPKRSATISEIDGTAEIIDIDGKRTVKVTNSEFYLDEYPMPSGSMMAVADGQLVDVGTALFSPSASSTEEVGEQLPAIAGEQAGVARVAGQVIIEDNRLYIRYEEREEKEYVIPPGTHLLVRPGSKVKAGESLTEGTIAPQDILRIGGREAVQRYLIDEVQKIYRSQGVNIHDKHISVVVREMLSKVKITSSGDTTLLPGELISRFDYEDINAKVLAEGGEPATAQAVLLGITKVSLDKDSWLAAASFQETGHILINAAIRGKIDKLRGLKENVILGRLIPSRVLADEEIKAIGSQLDAEATSSSETSYSERLAMSK